MDMKGIVLTIDAVIALLIMVTIIFLLVFFRTESVSPFFQSRVLHSLSEDVLTVLSESSLREIITNKTMLDEYNQSGIINSADYDRKAIDVIGALYSVNDSEYLEAAKNITKDILDDFLPNNIGYQILINGDNVCNSSDSNRTSYSEATTEISSARIASGYEKGKNVSGCVAMAYLTNVRDKKDSYVYFGGYVGDGNVTANISLPSSYNMTEAYMEMNVGTNFTLFINNQPSGIYNSSGAASGLMKADNWTVCNLTYQQTFCSNFIPGNNIIKFNFTESSLNNSFIGGGYFRITYNTTALAPQQEYGNDTYWFPGIAGFFNLYDSFYVPGSLVNVTTYLHYFNNITINETNSSVYLKIGSVKVFNSSDTGEKKINLYLNNFSQSFGSLQNLIGNVSNKTIPLRFGIEGFDLKPGVGTADAVLVTDVSGSMDTYDVLPGNQQRLAVAKVVDAIFVDTVLSTNGDRVGLVSYSDSLSNTHQLSNNSAALKGNISLYVANGCTCISCGISSANSMLDAVVEERFKGLLVMSDGYANRCLLGDNCGIYGTSPSCTDSPDPFFPSKLEAINKSCEARSKNFTVFSVGFGSKADNITLQRVACWNCTACKIDLNCNGFSDQSTCQASPECFWNSTAPVNKTIFHSTFDSVSTTTNCQGVTSDGWNDCNLGEPTLYWRAVQGGSENSSSTRFFRGSDIDTANATFITKCIDLSSYDKAYISFDWSISHLDSGEFILIRVNRTGSPTFTDLWNSGTGNRNWRNSQINVTNNISSYTCFRVYCSLATDNDEYCDIDDFKILGTEFGRCDNNFTSNSPCWIGNVTLPNGTQAACMDVRYAQSNNVSELTSIYEGFGQWFINLGYTTQKANIGGNMYSNNILYPDSYIDLEYSPLTPPYEYGEISLTEETPRFGDLTNYSVTIPYKEGWFNVSDKVVVEDARISSYSSDYWTDLLLINSSVTGGWKEVFNLSYYGNNYSMLGDPFIIHMPVDKISAGNNSVRIETGIGPNFTTNSTDRKGGSPYDRIFYTIRVKGSVGYGSINETCEGASKDALKRLNDSIGGYLNVNTNEIQIHQNNISSVPYMWGPASIRVRVWA